MRSSLFSLVYLPFTLTQSHSLLEVPVCGEGIEKKPEFQGHWGTVGGTLGPPKSQPWGRPPTPELLLLSSLSPFSSLPNQTSFSQRQTPALPSLKDL